MPSTTFNLSEICMRIRTKSHISPNFGNTVCERACVCAFPCEHFMANIVGLLRILLPSCGWRFYCNNPSGSQIWQFTQVLCQEYQIRKTWINLFIYLLHREKLVYWKGFVFMKPETHIYVYLIVFSRLSSKVSYWHVWEIEEELHFPWGKIRPEGCGWASSPRMWALFHQSV